MGNGTGTSGAARPRASRVLVVVAWALAAVLAGSVTSWAVAVIGDEHGSSRDRVLSAAEVDALLTAATATATPTASPSASPGASPSTSAGPVPSASPNGPGPTPTATASSPEPPAPPAVVEVVRTWDVTGGRIDASCRGATFRLLAATPLDGWTVEVDENGPDGAKVELHRDGQESTSRVTCVGGVPTLSERTGDSAGDSADESSGDSSED